MSTHRRWAPEHTGFCGYAGAQGEGPWCWVHAQNVHAHCVGEPMRDNPEHVRCRMCGHDFQPLHPVVVDVMRAIDGHPESDYCAGLRVIRALGDDPLADVSGDLSVFRASCRPLVDGLPAAL